MSQQYIPPQNLIDSLKIKNNDESVSNNIVKSETHKVQVKTPSLLISAEPINNTNRNSPEFQEVVESLRQPGILKKLREMSRLKKELDQYNFKNDESINFIKSNGRGPNGPTKPSLNTPKNSPKTSGKTKHGFATGFQLPANTPKRRSHQLDENSKKLHHVLSSQSFPDDNSDSDASCDSDYEFKENEIIERTVQHDQEKREKKKYYVCRQMNEHDQEAILLLEKWSDRLKINEALSEDEIRLQYDLFISSLNTRGLTINCDFNRFERLATENSYVSASTVFEARTALLGEAYGWYENVRRPSDPGMNLDFEIDGLGKYINCRYMDAKGPRDFKNIPPQKRTFREACGSISRNIHRQKLPYIKNGNCEVLHLVNFERLVDVETRVSAEYRIKKGFNDPMNGFKGKPDPVLLRRFTKFINIYPQY